MKPLEKQDQLVARTLEIERSVLGGILIENDRFHDAREFISERDFFRVGHRLVFAAIDRLMSAGRPVDLQILIQILSAEDLETAGGPAELASLVNGVPRATNVAAYAQEVAEKATLRALAYQAQKILTAAQQADDNASTILEEAERAILAIRDRNTRVDVATPHQRARATFEQVGAIIAAGGALRGIPTGLKDLDADLRGLHRGNLITIGARPSMGKTALAKHFAIAGGATGVPALEFSLEMSLDEINLREVTTRAGVDGWRLTHGKASPWEQRQLMTAIEAMQDGNVYTADAPHVTVGQMSAISRRFKAQHGLSLVTVDYLQLIVPERRHGERVENRTVELGAMSRALKGLARELDVPVVLLSQLSRNNESRPDKRPQMSDLRESGAIEQDSDVVLLLHRPNAYPDIRAKNQYRDHYAEVNIAKQRNGPTGIVQVAFYREQTRFADYTEEPEVFTRQATLGPADLPLDGATA